MTRQALCLIMAACAALAMPAAAQDLVGRTITDVSIQGLERVSESLVQSQLEVKPGQVYNPRAIARDIRRLYDLGHFSMIKVDASPDGDDVAIAYVLEEKRVIDEITLIGNDKIRDRLVRAELTWREGDTFVPEAYDEERDAVLSLYQSKGFPNASVDVVVEEIGPQRVKIILNIDEGKKARIRSIGFTGQDALSARKLRKVIKTRRSWLFIGGKYDEDKFEADLQNVLDTYGDYGRLEAEVVNTEFAYRKRGKGVDVTIDLNEGPEYTVGALEIANNIVFDDDEIQKLLKVLSGDVHNRSQVREDAALVQKGYSDSGYVKAGVTPQVTLDREAHTTHLVHRIDEGDLKYVREIKITGNSVTRDDVIRREVLVVPGQRFDGGLLEATKRRLNNTEYFDEARFTLEDALDDDRYSNLLIDVDEGKTSFWNFGFGYSTEEAFNTYTELRFRNFDIANWPSFSGGGQQFRLKLNIGDRRSEYSLGFTDPEFLGYPIAAGFDIFNESYQYEGGTEYTEKTQGAQLRLGKFLSPYVSARTSLRYRTVDISDFAWSRFSIYEQLRGGKTTISSIWGINRTTLDSKRDPASGALHDLQLEIAGLGGDNHFLKLEHDSTWYWPLTEEERWILSLRTREGIALPYGSSPNVPLSDRYFAGGATTVRGFKQRDIGPTAKRYFLFGEEDRIGGELRLVNNLEVKYKITDAFRTYAFADAGGAWEDVGAFDPAEMKFSLGLGFGVDVPKMGPIRVDYGFPLNPDGDQGSGRLHLQTGFRF